eukprot:scaffold9272_cov195-Amphora_coffeaeformis.AAC.2
MKRLLLPQKHSFSFRAVIILLVYYCQLANVMMMVKGEIGATSGSSPPWKSFLSRLRPRRKLADPYHNSSNRSSLRFPPFPPPSLVKPTTSTNANDAERRILMEQQMHPATNNNKGGESSVELRRDYNASPSSQRQPLRPQQLWKVLWQSLPPSFHDTRQWGRWLASGLQIGCIVYLAHAIWKTIGEVLDEYYAAEGGDAQHGMEPPVFGREHVQQALEQLSRSMAADTAQTTAAVSPSWRASSDDHRSMAALAIAQRLVLIGLPLRNTNTNNNNNQGGGAGTVDPNNSNNHSRSVESILSTISRQEANLLQECLWLPPRGESPPHMWERILGLDRVKRGLMSALATVQRRTPHAYASLFDNASAGVLLYGP